VSMVFSNVLEVLGRSVARALGVALVLWAVAPPCHATPSRNVLQPAWTVDGGGRNYLVVASNQEVVAFASAESVMAVSAKTGRKLWVADLHPLWDKENGQAKPSPALFVTDQAVLCVRVWNDTDVTVLDLHSGATRGTAKFNLGSYFGGLVQAGDSAVCMFRSWDKAEPSFQTISLVDAKVQAGVSAEAKAALPERFLSFGSEAFWDLKPIEIPDYTGNSDRPPAGRSGSRSLCFLDDRKRVVSVSTESYYIDDMHGPYETHRVALWRQTAGGYARVWGYELFRPYMGEPQGTKNPVIGCGDVLAFDGQAWLFGGTGVYRVTDAGPVQGAKGVRTVAGPVHLKAGQKSPRRVGAERDEDYSDAVTSLLVVGRKLYGYCLHPTGAVSLYEYRGGAFRNLGKTTEPEVANAHRYSGRFFGSTSGGFLRAVSRWDDGDAEIDTVYEMYRLPG